MDTDNLTPRVRREIENFLDELEISTTRSDWTMQPFGPARDKLEAECDARRFVIAAAREALEEPQHDSRVWIDKEELDSLRRQLAATKEPDAFVEALAAEVTDLRAALETEKAAVHDREDDLEKVRAELDASIAEFAALLKQTRRVHEELETERAAALTFKTHTSDLRAALETATNTISDKQKQIDSLIKDFNRAIDARDSESKALDAALKETERLRAANARLYDAWSPISEWCEEAHRLAVSKGFHDWTLGTDRKPTLDAKARFFVNLHAEVSEAWECIKKGQTSIVYETDPLKVTYNKPEGLPIELADIALRLFDTCAALGVDLEAAMKIKHEYNKPRPWKHGKLG